MSDGVESRKRKEGRTWLIVGCLLIVVGALIYFFWPRSLGATETFPIEQITALISAIAGLVFAITGLVKVMKNKKSVGE